ncbi:hypothetical protein GCM10009532_30770 [Microbacterium aurantiacum]
METVAHVDDLIARIRDASLRAQIAGEVAKLVEQGLPLRLPAPPAIVLAAAEGVVTSDARLAEVMAGFTEFGLADHRMHRGGFRREAGTDR